MSDAGYPQKHGYIQCVHCKVWRPKEAVKAIKKGPVCIDSVWCRHERTRQAK